MSSRLSCRTGLTHGPRQSFPLFYKEPPQLPVGPPAPPFPPLAPSRSPSKCPTPIIPAVEVSVPFIIIPYVQGSHDQGMEMRWGVVPELPLPQNTATFLHASRCDRIPENRQQWRPGDRLLPLGYGPWDCHLQGKAVPQKAVLPHSLGLCLFCAQPTVLGHLSYGDPWITHSWLGAQPDHRD